MRALLLALSVVFGLLALLYIITNGLTFRRATLDIAAIVALIALILWSIFRRRDTSVTPFSAE